MTPPTRQPLPHSAAAATEPRHGRSDAESGVAEFRSTSVTLTGPEQSPIPASMIRVGTGAKVVFLHGLVGLNEHWEDVVRQMCGSADCTMLEIPLLALEGDDCHIEGATQIVAKFLAEHILPKDAKLSDRAILVGNSFGGHVALKLAIEYPHLVRGLILAGASGLIEKSIVSTIEIRPSKDWLRKKIEELFYDRSKMKESDLDRAFEALSNRGGARAMVKLSRSARKNHLGDKLHKVHVPTQLIWGRQDIVTPPEAADGFLKGIKDCQIEWFENCGHAPMIECPNLFAATSLSYLAGLTRRGI
jgi:pimeloyl-ACP methyl ester carboxylesterase